VKRRSALCALIVCITVTSAFAARARASASVLSCGPWQHCFCRSIGCGLGEQLCAQGAEFTCYQGGLTAQ
jgi:hypothetical protein